MRKQIYELIEGWEEEAWARCDCPAGHDIFIGDVLQRLDEKCSKGDWSPSGYEAIPHLNLMAAWRKVGLSESLQEIFDCEWVDFCHECGQTDYQNCKLPDHTYIPFTQVPKDPATRALGEFLLSVFKPI